MANEAKLIFETGPPIPFTVANGTGIEKGTPLVLTDLMTAIAATALGQPAAGIAAAEKIASDGKIRLAVYREGIFRVAISGSVTVGDPLTICAGLVNEFEKAATNEEDIWGTVFETASDTHTALMELKPISASLA